MGLFDYFDLVGYTPSVGYIHPLSPRVPNAALTETRYSWFDDAPRHPGLVGSFCQSYNGDAFTPQLMALRPRSFTPGATIITDDVGG